jgi:hypothetical protein
VATKKTTTTKIESLQPTTDSQDPSTDAIVFELQKQTEYLHRMDWKLWMLMNMIRTMGEDNGYIFKFNEESV